MTAKELENIFYYIELNLKEIATEKIKERYSIKYDLGYYYTMSQPFIKDGRLHFLATDGERDTIDTDGLTAEEIAMTDEEYVIHLKLYKEELERQEILKMKKYAEREEARRKKMYLELKEIYEPVTKGQE